MSKYLFVFRGGAPTSPEQGEKLMADWGAWLTGMGDAVLDPGSIVGKSHFTGPAAEPVSGYMLIEEKSLDAALAHAQSCPIHHAQGSVEVAAFAQM